MKKQQEQLRQKIRERVPKVINAQQFKKLGLFYNPFPRSGISDININNSLIGYLEPVDEDVNEAINTFVVDSLFPQNPRSDDKYISAVIRGDYGNGKTQTLMYIKYLLESFSRETKELHKSPFVIYIDNPGAKLTELIGSIISQVGEENFKKYLWDIAKKDLINKKDKLQPYLKNTNGLFPDERYEPFSELNLINYKAFIDSCYLILSKQNQKKKLQEEIREIIFNSFNNYFENSTISRYFYDLLTESIGLTRVWEDITSGNLKAFEKKEVFLIRAIVDLVEQQGYTDFYILVDLCLT